MHKAAIVGGAVIVGGMAYIAKRGGMSDWKGTPYRLPADEGGLLSDVGAWFGIGGESDMSETRGIRNNNPGNIVLNGIPWRGLSANQTDGRFAQFNSAFYGLRALASILDTYRDAHGLDTVDGIIHRWSATDQDAYVYYVASQLDIGEREPLPDNDATTAALVAAIVDFENGTNPYSEALIKQAVNAA